MGCHLHSGGLYLWQQKVTLLLGLEAELRFSFRGRGLGQPRGFLAAACPPGGSGRGWHSGGLSHHAIQGQWEDGETWAWHSVTPKECGPEKVSGGSAVDPALLRQSRAPSSSFSGRAERSGRWPRDSLKMAFLHTLSICIFVLHIPGSVNSPAAIQDTRVSEKQCFRGDILPIAALGHHQCFDVWQRLAGLGGWDWSGR